MSYVGLVVFNGNTYKWNLSNDLSKIIIYYKKVDYRHVYLLNSCMIGCLVVDLTLLTKV